MATKSSKAINPNNHRLTYTSPFDSRFKKMVIGTIEKMTGLRYFQKIYNELREEHATPHDICEKALKKLDIKLNFSQEQLNKIPTEGPIIFIANHPFGVIDGFALCHIVSRKREDFFILVNEVISKEPIMKDHFLPVDFRGTDEANQLNQLTKAETSKRLKEGGALVIFPGGGVATAKNGFGQIKELKWHKFICNPIHEVGCTVVPIYFHGRNSRLFQVVSQFSLKLRLALLIHEVTNKRGKTLQVEIGDPIPYAEMEELQDRQELIDFLHSRTMELGKIKLVKASEN